MSGVGGPRGWAPGERAAVERQLPLPLREALLSPRTKNRGRPLASEWLGVVRNYMSWQGCVRVRNRPELPGP